MNLIKLQDIDGEIVEEIEINTKEPSETTTLLAEFRDEPIVKVIYPKNMPESNGFRKLLESTIKAFQTMGAFPDTEVVQSQVDTWIKGGFSTVDIDTAEYWKARGYTGDLEVHAELIEQYKISIEAVKHINKALRSAGLLTGTLKFGTYCYTLKSDKSKKD